MMAFNFPAPLWAIGPVIESPGAPPSVTSLLRVDSGNLKGIALFSNKQTAEQFTEAYPAFVAQGMRPICFTTAEVFLAALTALEALGETYVAFDPDLASNGVKLVRIPQLIQIVRGG